MKNLQINDIAPSFTSVDQNGNPFSSEQLRGKKWVLYFYPKDLTPGCTNQACNLRDNYKILSDHNITIIGVSMDKEKLHQRFIKKHKLPFMLLSDQDKSVIEAFGVWGEKKFMGRTYNGIHRTTFLMDEHNVIIGIIEKPKTKDHAAEILKKYNEIEERK